MLPATSLALSTFSGWLNLIDSQLLVTFFFHSENLITWSKSVKYLLLRDYQSITNISDENDTIDSNNRARFANGAYITVDAIISVDGANYDYDLTPTTNKIENFPFASKDLDLTSYKEGFYGDVKKIKIDNLLTYNQYIFKKYVWWQCLIALFVLGGIMTLFYFTFTYEEKKPLKNKK